MSSQVQEADSQCSTSHTSQVQPSLLRSFWQFQFPSHILSQIHQNIWGWDQMPVLFSTPKRLQGAVNYTTSKNHWALEISPEAFQTIDSPILAQEMCLHLDRGRTQGLEIFKKLFQWSWCMQSLRTTALLGRKFSFRTHVLTALVLNCSVGPSSFQPHGL